MAAQLRRDRVVCLFESFWGWFAAPYPNGQPVLPPPRAWVGALRTLLGDKGCLAPLLSTSLSHDSASSLPSWGLLTYPPPSRELPPFLLTSCLQPPSCYPSLPSCLFLCLSSSKRQCSLPSYLTVCAGPTLPTPPDS